MKIFRFIKKSAEANIQKKDKVRDNEFVWSLAEALLWRDEEVGIGAIPTPIKEQPRANIYYDDALYLINASLSKFDCPEDNDNA